MELTKEIQDELATEFPAGEIKWLPRITTKKGPNNTRVNIERGGKRVAGCMAHIDARQVMQRLDDVVGVGGWSDAYQPAAIGKGVECTLTVLGVSKTDVGVVSDTEPEKGAYSDALKRAAVKFGIGRHLYDIDTQWLPFDGYKITSEPSGNSGAKGSPPDRKPVPAHIQADLRATIEGVGEKVKLGFICDKLAMSGHYDHVNHALNALRQWDGWPEAVDTKALTARKSLPNDKALELYDWGIARKSE